MLENFQQRIAYTFKDPQLLQLALSHKSHANEGRKKGVSKEAFVGLHNERLEFLGDTVLGLVISDLLFEGFQNVDEGKLSKMRSSLVKETTLAEIARSLQLGEVLLLGKGEKSTKGQEKDSILASSYEALLGGIYLDGGLPAAYATIRVHFALHLQEVVAISSKHDTKTQLQEVSQAKVKKSPNYQVVSEEGPDHEKIFEVMVSVGALKRYGKGRNKKEAEQVAAKYLLDFFMAHPEQVENV